MLSTLRRHPTRLAFAVVAIAGVMACTADSPDATPTPNVVLITIDALRADHVSWADPSYDLTPELARLATESVVFRQAISSFQSTTGAMPSLMTGRWPSFEGVATWTQSTRYGFAGLATPGERGRRGLTSNVTTLAEVLAARGYRTAGFNTNPHLSIANHFNQGFEEYEQFKPFLEHAQAHRRHPLESAYPPADLVSDAVTDWLGHTDDRPFFVWAHFMEPHSPYLPPAPFDRQFPPGFTALADLEVNEALYHLLFATRGSRRAKDYRSGAELGVDKPSMIGHAHALYRGEVRFCDQQVARIIAALRSSGRLDRTLLIVTADHGEEFGEHGHVFHDWTWPAPEELIRIPLLIRLPGGAHGGSEVDDLVRMVDIAPTVLEVVGLGDGGLHLDGRSLRPLWTGEGDTPRTAFISMIDYGVARDATWKYRLDKASGREHLFHIQDDPLEEHDVAAQNPAAAAGLRSDWTAHAGRLRDRATVPVGWTWDGELLEPDEAERLDALGYTAESTIR